MLNAEPDSAVGAVIIHHHHKARIGSIRLQSADDAEFRF